MALADDIAALRHRTLAELVAAHDYFEDTRTAWGIVSDAVLGGTMFANQNQATGTVTSQADLVAKSGGYIAEQMTQATFQQFIAIFEAYFFDLLRLLLVADPRSLSGKKVDFKTVLEAPDKDAIALHVVNKELNEVMYERPAGWFAYLEDRLELGCPSADEIASRKPRPRATCWSTTGASRARSTSRRRAASRVTRTGSGWTSPNRTTGKSGICFVRSRQMFRTRPSPSSGDIDSEGMACSDGGRISPGTCSSGGRASPGGCGSSSRKSSS